MVTLGSEHLAWVCETLVRVRMLQLAWGLLEERVRGTWWESSGRSLSGRFRHAVVGTLARATGDSYSNGPLVQKSTEPVSSGHTVSRPGSRSWVGGAWRGSISAAGARW